MPTYYDRKAANDDSRNRAEHHTEEWAAEEVALLEECWNDVPLEEIAETLGRTIEACRQKHYEIGRAKVRRAQDVIDRAEKTVDRWTKGFTSLEDMERHFNER